MTFIEALNWMSESEENVAMRLPDSPADRRAKYSFKEGALKILDETETHWSLSMDLYNNLRLSKWSKSEPELEEVEVVAYMSEIGVLEFSMAGSKDEKNFAGRGNWRKVRVKWAIP